MIILFSGSDADTKHKAYEKFIQSFEKDSEVFDFSRNNFDAMQIESLYSGANLFSAKSLVVLRDVLGYEETRDFILEKLISMGESANSFVFLEGGLNKPVFDAFKKARAEINVFDSPNSKKEKFNTFLLANAFEGRDKLNLWIYFRQAIESGAALEELAGILFWKAKDMVLKKNFRKFSEVELAGFVSHVAYLLPKARTEGKDAEAALEQFLLEVF